MSNNQGAIGHALLSGGVITGSQNAAQQNAMYNSMVQSASIASNPHAITAATGWRDYERSRASVSINVERASNGYIIRAEGSSTIAATLEELQQHVTGIVVSTLVLDESK